jgi:hypothetical protein
MRICQVCHRLAIERATTIACFECAKRIAEYVLTANTSGIATLWDTSETLDQRRTHLLRVAEKRTHELEAAEISAGLAIGYLHVGLLDDALITAAISVRFGPTEPDFCWCSIDVLLSDRLLKPGALRQLATLL